MAAAVALAGAAPAAASTDTAAGASFHPFTMPLDNGCVRLSDDHGTSYNCDPVNVLFPDRTWPDVLRLLLDNGWTKLDLGSIQRLHFGDSTLYGQDAQLFREDAPDKRYHIRLWEVRGVASTVTVGAVHHEEGRLQHRIDMHWDEAEAFVAGQLCGSACSTTGLLVNQDLAQGSDGVWRGWANDAKATVVP